jgi:hypothetical protein
MRGAQPVQSSAGGDDVIADGYNQRGAGRFPAADGFDWKRYDCL